jgi:hypothetical protein
VTVDAAARSAMAVGAVAAALGGCSLWLDYSVDEGASTSNFVVDPSLPQPPDAARPAPPPTAAECARVADVSRPQGDRGTGARTRFALTRLSPGYDLDPNVPLGMNLDLTCTTSEASASCRSSDGAPREDGRGGIDVGGYALLKDLQSIGVASGSAAGYFDPQRVDAAVARGVFGMLVDVDGYNGLDDDDDVTVYLRPATARVAPPPGELSSDTGAVWSLDSAFASPGLTDVSLLMCPHAFVQRRTLFAACPSVELPVSLGDGPAFVFRLNDAYLRATIVQAARGAPARLEAGLIAGRWDASSLLGGIHDLLCAQQAIMPAVKKLVCERADLASAAVGDGKGEPCAALGLGLAFSAYALDPATSHGRGPRVATAKCATPAPSCD